MKYTNMLMAIALYDQSYYFPLSFFHIVLYVLMLLL